MKTGSEVRLKVKLGSGSLLLGHQGPHCWDIRAPLSGWGIFGFMGIFFLEITMLQSGFQKQSKTTTRVREQVCPGALTLCQGHLCDLLGVAGSAPHVQGGAVISPRSMLTAAHPWTGCFCTCGKLGPRNSMCSGDAAHPFPTGKGSGGSQSPAVPWPLAPHAQSGGHSGRCSVYTIAF